ncbi:hypothetical protein PINS_up007550 [Pythium insidiosum]|nr:hypothetical protein PINS_up007550 [Pythium insidiosum]
MRVSTFVATLKYRFGMLPVPLERMDLLEAIVRDHGEAIRAGAMPLFVHFEAAQCTSSGNLVKWTPSGDSDAKKFTLDDTAGTVVIQSPGYYEVHLTGITSATRTSTISLLVGDARVKAHTFTSYCNGYNASATFSVAMRLVRRFANGDRFSVKIDGEASLTTADLTLRRVY